MVDDTRRMDRIRSIVKTGDGTLWVASSSGVSSFEDGVWTDVGEEEGLLQAPLQSLRGQPAQTLDWHRPWCEPLHPEKRRVFRELRCHARKCSTASPDGDMQIRLWAMDKWKNTPAERLFYSYRLDRDSWSPVLNCEHRKSSPYFSWPPRHQVRAMDRRVTSSHPEILSNSA